jgi:hypothetical protein
MATFYQQNSYAWRIFAFFASLCLIFSPVPGVAQYTGQVTIGQYSAFTSLRPCAQSCFVGNGDGDGYLTDNTPDIEDELGCGFGALNECLCRSDLMVTATSFLSSCVLKECSNSNDVTSAVTVYSNYCVLAANGPAASTTSGKLIEGILTKNLWANGSILQQAQAQSQAQLRLALPLLLPVRHASNPP